MTRQLTLTPHPLTRRTYPLPLLLTGAVAGGLLGLLGGGVLLWLNVGPDAPPLLSVAIGVAVGTARAAFGGPLARTGERLTLYGPTARPLQLDLSRQNRDDLRDAQRLHRTGQGDTLIRYVTPSGVTEFYASDIRTAVTD